jgi:hypothetical protein
MVMAYDGIASASRRNKKEREWTPCVSKQPRKEGSSHAQLDPAASLIVSFAHMSLYVAGADDHASHEHGGMWFSRT